MEMSRTETQISNRRRFDGISAKKQGRNHNIGSVVG
jgi:hypothetical protein